MSRVTRHLRVGIVSVLLSQLAFGPLQADAVTAPTFVVAEQPKVIITELQTTGNSASEEFVELYNTTDAAIDFADTTGGGKDIWKLQFYSATSTASGTPDWTKPSLTVSLSGVVPAHGYYVVAASGYLPGGTAGDQNYSSRLSDTGGGLQVSNTISSATTIHDRLMWKQRGVGQTLPFNVLASPSNKGSLQRLPNDDDEYIDTAQETGQTGQLTQLADTAEISPWDIWRAPLPVEEPEVPDSPGTPSDPSTGPGTDTDPNGPDVAEPDLIPGNAGLANPYLSELLPNPASPLKDETDEFIEVYNPNNTPFDLKGYSLQVGTSTLHDFTFTDSAVVPALGYRAFYSVDTRLSLTNSGGQARLLDASGGAVNETTVYTAASEGAAWAYANETWQWTTDVTPNALNAIALVAAKKPTAAAAKTATTAKKTPSKSAATKVKGTSKTKPKAAAKAKTAKAAKQKKAAKPKVAAASMTTEKPPRAPIHTGVLVAVGVLAVLYAVYEYRHDISNRIYKLRSYRTVRRFARQ
jgi:hypothetical protein